MRRRRAIVWAALVAVFCLEALSAISCRDIAVGDPKGQIRVGEVAATANPLVASYSISPGRDAMVSVDFGLDTTYPLHTSAVPTPPGWGTVSVLVAGMKAMTTYHMRAHMVYSDGEEGFDSDHTFTTGSVPPNQIPPLAVSHPSSDAPTPGIEMYELTQGTSNQYQLCAFDTEGNLIWYYNLTSKTAPQAARLLANGHILVISGTTPFGELREIDLAGRILWNMTVADMNNLLASAGIPLAVEVITHEELPLANGHIIVLASISKEFTNLPGYPGTTRVQSDALIDLDENHKPVWYWSAFDHLDVNRHPMSFPDWTHSNAILYTSGDGNLLLSTRHQSWIIKIDYEDGKGDGHILWRLGYQGDFALQNGTDPVDWFFAQHYPSFVGPDDTGDFKLAMFDNGDNRVMDASGTACGSAGAPACYSRVPIFEVNEATKTATLLWDDNLSPVYSFWGGSVQVLDNGNICFDETTPSDLPGPGTRYLEVTQETPPRTLLEITVSGQYSYRTTHWPSLYPGVQW